MAIYNNLELSETCWYDTTINHKERIDNLKTALSVIVSCTVSQVLQDIHYDNYDNEQIYGKKVANVNNWDKFSKNMIKFFDEDLIPSYNNYLTTFQLKDIFKTKLTVNQNGKEYSRYIKVDNMFIYKKYKDEITSLYSDLPLDQNKINELTKIFKQSFVELFKYTTWNGKNNASEIVHMLRDIQLNRTFTADQFGSTRYNINSIII